MAFYRWRVRNPFEEMLRMQNEMNRMMQSWNEGTGHNTVLPPVNVYDDGNNFYVRAEAAGLDSEKLDVSVAGDVLTIKGVRHAEELKGSYHRRERTWDQFSRSITVPDTVDVDNVRATYKHGVLEVTLPRAPEVRPRKISIESR